MGTKKGGKKENPFSKNPVLREFIKRVAGENGLLILSKLWGKQLTDEELAKLTRLRVNLVRKILYDLYENRVVNYHRFRNEDNGWYIYRWYVEMEGALENLQSIRQELLRKLEERLEYERGHMFFSCKNNCPRMTFEEASEHEFKCPHCGEPMEFMDNRQIIASLEAQVEELRRQWDEKLTNS
ncbi:MAG: transcription factor E [Candidatus Hadarchaeales archaeon]